MSQDLLHSNSPAGRAPADAIESLTQGAAVANDLLLLSDLSRTDAKLLAGVWHDLDVERRESIVRQLTEIAENDVQYVFWRVFRIAMRDRSPVVRQLAVAALWEDERTDLIDGYLDLFANDESQDVRAEAARALGRYAERGVEGDLEPGMTERIHDALLQTAADESAPYIVRRRAVESAGAFGRDAVVVDIIRDAYDSDDAGLRAGAVFAMGQSLDSGWLEVLQFELTSPDAEMRYEAARASGKLADDSMVPGLVDLTADDDAEVRHAAIEALGHIGGAGVVKTLRALANERRPADVEVIQAALEEAVVVADPLRAAR